MRWLCNENIPRLLVEALKQRGHDVLWIAEVARGMADADVVALAARDRRICLTFDKDFGELAAKTTLPIDCGVVLLRLSMQPSIASAARLAATIHERTDWAGHFSVIEPGRVWMRSLRSTTKV